MNSLCRHLTRIAGSLVMWILIFPGPGMGQDSSSAIMASQQVNSGRHANGGGKIVISKLATESPHERLSSETTPDQLPLSARLQLQQTVGKRIKQSTGVKTQRQRSAGDNAKQPAAEQQASGVSVPTGAPPLSHEQHIAETPEMQEPLISGSLMPSDLTPLLSEADLQFPADDAKTDPQLMDIDNAPNTGKRGGDIQTSSLKPAPEYAPQQDSARDTAGIIARLLLKFSLITVCCITLFFSFSALQLAKSNQRSP